MSTEAKIFLNLGRKDFFGTAGLIGSIISGRPRDFLKDSRWFSRNAGNSYVLGIDNALNARRPLIIAYWNI